MHRRFVLLYCQLELGKLIMVVLRWPPIVRSGMVSRRKYIRQVFAIDILKACIHSMEKENEALTCFSMAQLFILCLFPLSRLYNLACTSMANIYEHNHKHSRASSQEPLYFLELFTERATVLGQGKQAQIQIAYA